MQCECMNEDCDRELPITDDQYKQVAAHDCFVMLPGHEVEGDIVIARRPDLGVILVSDKGEMGEETYH